MTNLHDKYDIEIEQACRLIPFDGRDNDESGSGMFWDLSAQVVNDLQYYKPEERQEILYNVFHKIREESIKQNNHDQFNEGVKLSDIKLEGEQQNG